MTQNFIHSSKASFTMIDRLIRIFYQISYISYFFDEEYIKGYNHCHLPEVSLQIHYTNGKWRWSPLYRYSYIKFHLFIFWLMSQYYTFNSYIGVLSKWVCCFQYKVCHFVAIWIELVYVISDILVRMKYQNY